MTAAQIRRQVVLTVTETDGGLTYKHLRELVTAANDAVLSDDTPVMIPNDTGGSKRAAWIALDGLDERPTVHEGGGRGRRATPGDGSCICRYEGTPGGGLKRVLLATCPVHAGAGDDFV